MGIFHKRRLRLQFLEASCVNRDGRHYSLSNGVVTESFESPHSTSYVVRTTFDFETGLVRTRDGFVGFNNVPEAKLERIRDIGLEIVAQVEKVAKENDNAPVPEYVTHFKELII